MSNHQPRLEYFFTPFRIRYFNNVFWFPNTFLCGTKDNQIGPEWLSYPYYLIQDSCFQFWFRSWKKRGHWIIDDPFPALNLSHVFNCRVQNSKTFKLFLRRLTAFFPAAATPKEIHFGNRAEAFVVVQLECSRKYQPVHFPYHTLHWLWQHRQIQLDRLDNNDFFFVVWKIRGGGPMTGRRTPQEPKRKKKSSIKNRSLFFQISKAIILISFFSSVSTLVNYSQKNECFLLNIDLHNTHSISLVELLWIQHIKDLKNHQFDFKIWFWMSRIDLWLRIQN